MSELPDIRALVRWLGVQGAKVGISESKLWPIELLRRIASDLMLKIPEKASRKELVEEIVRAANKRIDRPLKDLYDMESFQLIDYLNNIGVESEELLDLLKEIDVEPRRDGSRKSLIEFVARELSETGRFMRIAGTAKEDPK